MKFFIVLALVSAASAARLDNSMYLPPNAKSSSKANADLQAPLGGQDHTAYNAGGQERQSATSQAGGLNFEKKIIEKGYPYLYETSDGNKVKQQDHVNSGAQPEEGSLLMSGSYTYIGEDGKNHTVNYTYTADDKGFQAEHLPTPPPLQVPTTAEKAVTTLTRATKTNTT